MQIAPDTNKIAFREYVELVSVQFLQSGHHTPSSPFIHFVFDLNRSHHHGGFFICLVYGSCYPTVLDCKGICSHRSPSSISRLSRADRIQFSCKQDRFCLTQPIGSHDLPRHQYLTTPIEVTNQPDWKSGTSAWRVQRPSQESLIA